MGIPDPYLCLLRNLYEGQEATVRTGHETTNWFQIGKRVHQGCILSPCLFNLYAEYIRGNARLDEAQAGIKITDQQLFITHFPVPGTVSASKIGHDSLWFPLGCQKKKTTLK